MDETVKSALLIVIGGSIPLILGWILNRFKTPSETTKIAADTANIKVATEKMAAESDQVETTTQVARSEYYEKRSDKFEERLTAVEADQKAGNEAHKVEMDSMRAARDESQKEHIQMVAGLHTKIDKLISDLDASNTANKILNKEVKEGLVTIALLEAEVKAGNDTITALQAEVKAGNEKIAALEATVAAGNVRIDALQLKVNELLERLVEAK